MSELQLGQVGVYTLTSHDAKVINKRRTDFATAGLVSEGTPPDEPTGFQAHVGNEVREGDQFPMIVTRVWQNGLVNGQVLLDGNDNYWARSVPLVWGQK